MIGMWHSLVSLMSDWLMTTNSFLVLVTWVRHTSMSYEYVTRVCHTSMSHFEECMYVIWVCHRSYVSGQKRLELIISNYQLVYSHLLTSGVITVVGNLFSKMFQCWTCLWNPRKTLGSCLFPALRVDFEFLRISERGNRQLLDFVGLKCTIDILIF